MNFLHLATRRLYRFNDLAVNETDNTPMVTYSGLYSDTVWVRPAAEFFDGRFEPWHGQEDDTTEEEVTVETFAEDVPVGITADNKPLFMRRRHDTLQEDPNPQMDTSLYNRNEPSARYDQPDASDATATLKGK
jgi:hypothetical protein